MLDWTVNAEDDCGESQVAVGKRTMYEIRQDGRRFSLRIGYYPNIASYSETSRPDAMLRANQIEEYLNQKGEKR